MAVVHSYVFSMLVVHRTGLKDRFLLKHPNSWLVWEPVIWKPSTKPAADTLPADLEDHPQRPDNGDPICFELYRIEPLKLGRATECDIRINDAAVSRNHLLLEPVGKGEWRVRAAPTAPTLLRGQPMSDDGTILQPGDELRVGNIALTFHDAEGFVKRLDAAAAAKSAPK